MELKNVLKPMLSPDEVKEKLLELPAFPKNFLDLDISKKLQLTNLFESFYFPTSSVLDIYYKIYNCLLHAIEFKYSELFYKAHVNNYKQILAKGKLNERVGTSSLDSFAIVGVSGTGKTSCLKRIRDIIVDSKIVQIEKPYRTTLIPILVVELPFDSSAKSLLVNIIAAVDSLVGTSYMSTLKTTTTMGMLIAEASSILLNHVCCLVLDEAQNIMNKKGTNLIACLTELVNSCNVSIILVANPEILPFLSSDLKLSRRFFPTIFRVMNYDDEFFLFLRTLWQFQLISKETLKDTYIKFLYEVSMGIPAIVISLIRETNINCLLKGITRINLEVLRETYRENLYPVLSNKTVQNLVRKDDKDIVELETIEDIQPIKDMEKKLLAVRHEKEAIIQELLRWGKVEFIND